MKTLLTLRETAERVHRSEKSLRMLIFRRKFPFLKVGGKIMIDEGELENYLTLARRVTAEEAVDRAVR